MGGKDMMHGPGMRVEGRALTWKLDREANEIH